MGHFICAFFLKDKLDKKHIANRTACNRQQHLPFPQVQRDRYGDGEQLRQAVLKEFPDADIRTAYIGPIIGAHTGPGMLALIYWGTNR